MKVKKVEEKQEKKFKRGKKKYTWVGVTDVPSKHIGYPSKVDIMRRNFSLGEIKGLQKIKNDEKKTVQKLESAIKVEGMKIEELTIYDFEYLTFLLMFSSVPGGQMSYNFYCPKCGHKNVEVFTIDTGVHYTDLEIPALPIILPLSIGKELHFDLPRLKHQDIEMPEDIEDEDLFRIASLVTNMSAEEAYWILYEDVDNIDDIELIGSLDDLMYHGLTPVTRKCKGKPEGKRNKKTPPCGENITFKIETEGFYVMPFRKSKVDIRSKIRFGNDATSRPS